MGFRVHSLVALVTCIALVACVAACSPPASDDLAAQPPSGPAASEDATSQAQGTLGDFFAAWQAKDERAAESYLSPYRQGVTWQFERLDRVEFGPIAPSPEWIAEYLSNGAGSATGVAAEDVRCFRADTTFHYVPGSGGPSPEGEVMEWHWFLERDDAGTWRVTDWGY